LLVVVDETPECESALAFAASRAQRTGGQLSLLYVIKPDVDFQWLAVEDVAREEGHNKAKAVFRLFGRKLKAMGFEQLVPEEVVREGIKAEQITKLIEEDEDVGLLVVGASKDPSGPGLLVSTLVGGGLAGTFPVPITVVPGHLSIEEILALA
jgi:nucleotide-binding universal stress UspA family protein